jgi:hypothetical protein
VGIVLFTPGKGSFFARLFLFSDAERLLSGTLNRNRNHNLNLTVLTVQSRLALLNLLKPLLFNVLTVLTAVFLAGCSDSSQTSTTASSTNASSGNPVTAPVDYLNAIAKGKQSAEKTVDTTSLDRAIQMFGVDHGRNPKDLNELVQQKYIPKIPDAPYGTKLVYDANSGTVTVQKQ